MAVVLLTLDDGSTKEGVVVVPSVEEDQSCCIAIIVDATNLLAVVVAPLATCGSQELMGVTENACTTAHQCMLILR
jgi:hypothetical protein